MKVVSFCADVLHKIFKEQQERAPNKKNPSRYKT